MKTRENQRSCDDCFHREACHMWSNGAISNTVSLKCQQYEPVSYMLLKELRDLYKMHKGEVAPVRHGEWIPLEEPQWNCFGLVTIGYRCSECGREERYNNEPYCHCGAKMDGGKEHE